MFVDVKGTDNRVFKVPKTFYETVLKADGFTLVDSKPKKEVENVKLNGRTEKQIIGESYKTNSK